MKSKSMNITFSALFTALICILSQLCFVTPSIPLTLQTLGVALCGFTLSIKWSTACVCTYIAVGALGLPVFSGFKGGIQVLLGPTGGFLLGFIVLTAACGMAVNVRSTALKLLFPFLGCVLCHSIGFLQYSLVTGNGILLSFLTASLPFFVKDIICVILAYFCVLLLKKRLKL